MTDDTPAWMTERALAIAVEHTSDPHDQHRLQRDVLTAMKEAAREVALFFAANPEQIQEVPVVVHQFRRKGCADWYDGFPDNEDGRGPYETRTMKEVPRA